MPRLQRRTAILLAVLAASVQLAGAFGFAEAEVAIRNAAAQPFPGVAAPAETAAHVYRTAFFWLHLAGSGAGLTVPFFSVRETRIPCLSVGLALAAITWPFIVLSGAEFST